MEATPITRYHRWHVRLWTRFFVIATISALGAMAAVACALPNPAMFFTGVAAICVLAPLLSLAVGWPILLIYAGKAAWGLIRGRQRNGSGSSSGVSAQ